MIDRINPPKPRFSKPAGYLSFARETVAKDVPLYVVENDSQPYVTLQFVFRSGGRNDGALHGLADMVCCLLPTGAGRRDAVEFAQDVDYLGADLDVDASRETITVRLGVLKQYLPQALDLFADMVLRPQFDPEEVERERSQKIAMLLQNRSEPDWLAFAQLRQEIYGDSPYGHPMDGSEETLAHIDADVCRDFHATHFTPGNAFVVAAGDIRGAELREMLNERFADWSGPAPEPFSWSAPRPSERGRVLLVHRPGSAHAAVRFGCLGVPRDHPDFLPLRTLNTIFGDYFGCRLNMRLREGLGYTYGAGSVLTATAQPGIFVIQTSVGEKNVTATMEAILEELNNVATTPVGEDELERVQSYLMGHQALRMETPEQIAAMVRTIALYDLPDDYFAQTLRATAALDTNRLREVGSTYLRPERMSIVLAGNAPELAPLVERFGTVSAVDDRGNPIPL